MNLTWPGPTKFENGGAVNFVKFAYLRADQGVVLNVTGGAENVLKFIFLTHCAGVVFNV